jgi:hypothetical protein
MATEILPTNLADVVRVARAALVVLEDQEELVARAASAGPEDPVGLAVRAALEVPVVPGGLAVQAALVLPEDQEVLVALVVPAVQVVSENPAVPVELVVPAEAALVQGHRPVQLALLQRTKSVTANHHRGQVRLLAAEEDLAGVAETTRAPAAAEAAIAWAVADTAAVAVGTVAAVAAVGTVAVVAAEVAAVAAVVVAAVEDAGGKRNLNGENYENRTKHHDILENHHPRCSHPRNWLPRAGIDRSAGEEGDCCEARRGSGNTSTRAKAIRYAEAGGGRPYPSGGEF